MTPAEYGLWDVCRSLSYESGVLYFSGRKIADRFRGFSKNTAYTIATSLAERGWLKLLKDSVRRKDGTWSPRQYKVLSHSEWAAANPESCGLPVLNEGLEDDSPVPNQGLDGESPVPITVSPVPITVSPVPIQGHNLKENYLYKATDIEPDNLEPVPKQGLDDFQNRFLKPKAFAIQRRSAAAPQLETAPVPKKVQDTGSVLDTHSEAERIATEIASTVGIADQTERADWAVNMWKLINDGHSPNTILACAQHAHTSCPAGTVRKHGPSEFVRSFGLLKESLLLSQKGKTA
jgi:hypothetical protein